MAQTRAAEDQSHDLSRARADRHADADLARPLLHDEREDAEHAQRREGQRQQAHDARGGRQDTGGRQPAIAIGGERLRVNLHACVRGDSRSP